MNRRVKWSELEIGDLLVAEHGDMLFVTDLAKNWNDTEIMITTVLMQRNGKIIIGKPIRGWMNGEIEIDRMTVIPGKWCS